MSTERAIYTFDTTHHALWAEEVVKEAGIAFEVIPAPPEANARCSIALETIVDDIGRTVAVLKGAGVPHALYRGGGGGIEELAGAMEPERR